MWWQHHCLYFKWKSRWILLIKTDKPANPTLDAFEMARASSSVLNLKKHNINIKMMSLTMIY